MKRKCVLLLTVAWLVCSSGCGTSPQTLAERYCEYSKSEIEARMKILLRLKEIALMEEAKGKYSGIGTGLDGTKYTKINVTQRKNDLKWEIEDNEGNKIAGAAGRPPGTTNSYFRHGIFFEHTFECSRSWSLLTGKPGKRA